MSALVRNALIAKLKADVPALGGRVDTAVDLAELVEKNVLPKVFPAVYVLWSGDRPSPNKMANITVQDVAETASVVLVHKRFSDATGAKATEDVEPIVDAIIDSIVGYQIAPEIDPFEYQSGELIGLQLGAVFINLDFVTRRQLRK